MMRRLTSLPAPRRSPAIDASGALLATLGLGWAIPAIPAPGIGSIALAAGMPQVTALAAALGVGLLAWQLARLTVMPLAGRLPAALCTTLIGLLLLPKLGIAALAIPMILAAVLAWRSSRHRVVALMVQCGAGLATAGAVVNHIGWLQASVFLLMFPVVRLLYTPSGAANDNPSLERFTSGFSGCWNVQPMIQGGILRFRGSGEYRDV